MLPLELRTSKAEQPSPSPSLQHLKQNETKGVTLKEHHPIQKQPSALQFNRAPDKLVQITASKTLHHPIRKQQYNPQCISLTEQAPDTKATLAKCIFTKGCIFVTPPNSQRQLVQQNPPKDLRKAHLRLRNFVLQKKTHPKILPSTPAICLYTL